MRRMFSLKQLEEIANARVKALVEGGTLENAKPIYCHPVNLVKTSGDNRFILTMLIFNNDGTAFTLATWKTWLDNLATSLGGSVTIMCSGYYKNSDNEITSASYIYKSSNSYGLNGGKYNELAFQDIYGSWENMFEGATLSDNVNKIN